MVLATREIVTELMHSSAAVEIRPFKFVSAFRQAFPLFAQRTENGQGFVQQDAEECWSTLLTALSQRMVLATGDTPSNQPAGEAPVLPRMQTLRRTLGDMLFGIEFESSCACLEGDGIEPPYKQRESERRIACHISEKTAHLYTALEVCIRVRGRPVGGAGVGGAGVGAWDEGRAVWLVGCAMRDADCPMTVGPMTMGPMTMGPRRLGLPSACPRCRPALIGRWT